MRKLYMFAIAVICCIKIVCSNANIYTNNGYNIRVIPSKYMDKNEYLQMHSRQLDVYGVPGQMKLQNSRVLITGSYGDLLNEVLKNLVQSGLRHFDILCTEREMGSKIEGRRDMEAQVMSYMHAINPDVQINFIKHLNELSFASREYDFAALDRHRTNSSQNSSISQSGYEVCVSCNEKCQNSLIELNNMCRTSGSRTKHVVCRAENHMGSVFVDYGPNVLNNHESYQQQSEKRIEALTMAPVNQAMNQDWNMALGQGLVWTLNYMNKARASEYDSDIIGKFNPSVSKLRRYRLQRLKHYLVGQFSSKYFGSNANDIVESGKIPVGSEGSKRWLSLSRVQRKVVEYIVQYYENRPDRISGSVIGGVAASEAIKSILFGTNSEENSHFQHPLNQWFVFESIQSNHPRSLPDTHLASMRSELSNLNVVVVGAGAIGCELLKLLSMSHVGIRRNQTYASSRSKSGSGSITVVDMDKIELSNLNRQLYYRQQDVGHYKAVVAAQRAKDYYSASKHMNMPTKESNFELGVGVEAADSTDTFLNISGIVGEINESLLGPMHSLTRLSTQLENETKTPLNVSLNHTSQSVLLRSIQQADVVLSAVDNVETRHLLDRLCEKYGVFLIDGGTTGTMGSTQVVIPHISETYRGNMNYEASPVEASEVYESRMEGILEDEQMIPVCSIKSNPTKPMHCILWAKQRLFDELIEDISKFNEWLNANDNASTSDNLLNLIVEMSSTEGRRIRNGNESVSVDPILLLSVLKHPLGQMLLQHSGVPNNAKLVGENMDLIEKEKVLGKLYFTLCLYQYTAEILCLKRKLRQLEFEAVSGQKNIKQARMGVMLKESIHSRLVDMSQLVFQHVFVKPVFQDGELNMNESTSSLTFDRKNKHHVRFITYLCHILNQQLSVLPVAEESLYFDEQSMQVPHNAVADKNHPGDLESIGVILASLLKDTREIVNDRKLHSMHGSEVLRINFEKDRTELGHVGLLTAASNIRAQMYKIFPFRNPNGGNGILNEIDEVSVHKIAGKIIPALPTTTAIVAGLMMAELIKVSHVLRDTSKYVHNVEAFLGRSHNKGHARGLIAEEKSKGNGLGIFGWGSRILRNLINLPDHLPVRRWHHKFDVSPSTKISKSKFGHSFRHMDQKKLRKVLRRYYQQHKDELLGQFRNYFINLNSIAVPVTEMESPPAENNGSKGDGVDMIYTNPMER